MNTATHVLGYAIRIVMRKLIFIQNRKKIFNQIIAALSRDLGAND